MVAHKEFYSNVKDQAGIIKYIHEFLTQVSFCKAFLYVLRKKIISFAHQASPSCCFTVDSVNK